jgi:hypothetical protein
MLKLLKLTNFNDDVTVVCLPPIGSCQLLQLSTGQSCRGMLEPAKMADASCGSLASLSLGGNCRGFLTPLDDQVSAKLNSK